MSFFAEMQAAATESQTILAQMQGTTGNTLFAGQTVPMTLVYGPPRLLFIPQVGGGYRKRTEVIATMTRTQTDTPPGHQTKCTRIDLTPHVPYVIDHVDAQQALNYVLTLVTAV